MPIVAVVHVDDIFAFGLKSTYHRFCYELNDLVPVKNLGELGWFGDSRDSRDRKMGTLTISQKTFADELVGKFRIISEQSVPVRVGVTGSSWRKARRV